MASLSYTEASRATGIGESTLRYWVQAGRLNPQTEVRGCREVVVLDEAELRAYVAERDSHSSQPQYEGQSVEEGFALAPAWAMVNSQLASRDGLIRELQAQVGELQYRLGESTGRATQLQERLEEMQQWKREEAEAAKLKPKGFRWPWRRR